MKIGSKILSAGAGAVAAAFISSMIVIYFILVNLYEDSTTNSMKLTLTQADNVLRNIDFLHTHKAFDIQALVEQVAKDYPGQSIKDVYEKTTLYQTIPVVAAWQSVKAVADKEGYTFKTPSRPDLTPRNKNNDGAPYKEIFDAFKNGATEYSAYDKNTGHIVYAQPIKLLESCLVCHGDPATSKTMDGKDPLGLPMENMKVGDLKGAFVLTKPMSYTTVYKAAAMLFVLGGIIIALVLLGLARMNKQYIVKPLYGIVDSLRDTFGKMITASQEFNSASQQLAISSNNQATGIQETTAAVGALADVARKTADTSRKADNVAKQSSSQVFEGEEKVKKAVSSIQKSMGNLAESIKGIEAATQSTATVMETINSISTEINLLSLNAAVEAARAGSAGGGFAVVAEAVRTLAIRSANEVKNTSQLIGESQRCAEQVRDLSDGVQELLQKVVKNDILPIFAGMVTTSNNVSDLMANIVSDSSKQTSDAKQIHSATLDMDRITQQNAAIAEESAAASQELLSQANALKTAVDELEGMIR